MKIWLDLAEIDSVLKKLDWHDGGEEGKKGIEGEGSPTTLDWLNY